MTIDEIVEEYVGKQFTTYTDSVSNLLNPYSNSCLSIISTVDNSDIISLTSTKRRLKELYTEIEGITSHDFQINSDGLKTYYEIDINNFEQEVENIRNMYEGKINFIKQRHLDNINDAKSKCDEYVKLKQSELEEINKIYKELLTYKSDLEKISTMYCMPLSISKLDITKMSREELLDRFHIAKVAIDNILSKPSIFSQFLKYIDMDNDTTQLVLAVAFILFGYILRPYSLALISVMYIAYIIKDKLNVNKKKELLQMTYDMMGDFDFNKLIYDEEFVHLKDEVSFQEAITMDDDIRVLQDKMREEIDKISVDSPYVLLDKTNAAYIKYLQSEEYENRLAEVQDIFTVKQSKLLEDINTNIADIDNKIQKIKDSNIQLGEHFSNDMSLSMGMINMATFDGDTPIACAGFMMPRENTMFISRTPEQREEVVNYIQLLMCNFLCNVRPKMLRTVIYDQYGLGSEVTQFDVPDLETFVSIKTDKLDEVITELKNLKRERTTAFKGKTIEEYNSYASEKGMLTYNYRLLVILSAEGIESNKELMALMKNSTTFGVYIWCLMDASDKDKPDEYLSITDGFMTCEGYGKYKNKAGQILDPLKEGYKYLRYSETLGANTIGNFTVECDKVVIPSFIYEKDYLPFTIPDDKVWTYDTLDGIELHFGFENGDPMKPFGIVLGDEPPHCVMGGSTGSGKSVCINNVLATLLRMYSPRWLELVMVDLKRAEFGMYQGAAQIPHASVCAGTTDAEYMVSVFDYVLNEMERRNKLFEQNGVKNIKGYNKKMLKENRLDEIMPRILFLVDEFQEMFRAIDGNTIAVIKSDIARLASKARSCGVHMWFTSQSMAGTVSQDVLNQYAMRAALACPPDVSKSIIGTEKASELLGTKGWVYTNPTAGVDQKKTKIWKVPFIPDDYIPKYITELRERCDREGLPNRNPIFYDEEQLFEKEQLHKIIDKPKLKALDNLIVLGERVDYKPGNSPVSIRLNHDDKQNIAYTAYNRPSMLNGINTFIENIQSKDNVDLIIHSADKASTKLLNLKDRVEDKYKFFLDPIPTADIIEILEDSLAERKQHPIEELKTAYFIGVGWDKLDGIASSPVFKLIDKLKVILKEAPSYKLHFIICAKEWKELKKFIGELEYRIGSYTSENESFNVMNNAKLSKIKDYQMLGTFGSDVYKCKLYQFPINGTIEENIVDLTEVI